MKKRFEPINQKSSEIIEYLMSFPELPDSVEEQMKIRLCIEEAVVNITEYAYKPGVDGWLEASAELEDGVLKITLKDAGVRFNPLEKEDPDTSLSAEDRDIGGLGIYLCKMIMDDVEYYYEDSCNILVMSKKIA